MSTKTILYTLFTFLSCNSINNLPHATVGTRHAAKFEPAKGECLFFIGQDLGATGGLDNYSAGYCDFFEIPAGFTTYTGFSPGSSSFGYTQKGNDGIKSIANWGAGDICGQLYLNDKDYQYSMMAIGLSMVGHEKEIAVGLRNHLIEELANWIKESNRPVFLRIGYEFDGWDWNNYNREDYLKAWKHIHLMFQQMQVNNVAFVWQSKGWGSNQDILEQWYPGDDVVDWCAYSYFNMPDEEMIFFARKHKKPVFVAEATPVLQKGTEILNSKLTDPQVAVTAWDNWFRPFFNTLNKHEDVIKAFSYINVNWTEQPMWINNAVFQKADSRIQVSGFISKKWMQEIQKPRYLKPNAQLWKRLGYSTVK